MNSSLVIFADMASADALTKIEALKTNHASLFVDSGPLQDGAARTFYINAMQFTVSAVDAGAIVTNDEPVYHQILINMDLSRLSRIIIRPGNHVAQGRISLPVFETQVEAGRILGAALDAVAIGWPPSQSAFSFAYFDEAAERFCKGGAFPVLGFVRLNQAQERVFETQGLDYFTGYDLRLLALPEMKPHEAMRIMVRLVNDIVCNGDMPVNARVPGREQGEFIVFQNSYQREGARPAIDVVEAVMINNCP